MWNDTFVKALGATCAFGAVGIGLTIFGYKLFDWLAPKIDVQDELAAKQNVAVAIVVAAVILGVSWVVSAAIS